MSSVQSLLRQTVLVQLALGATLWACGCHRAHPRVSIELLPVAGTPMTLLRCVAEDLPPPHVYRWSLSGLHTAVGGAPLDGPALLVQSAGKDRPTATCSVATESPPAPGKKPTTATAPTTTTMVVARTVELTAPHIDHARRKGEQLTLDGVGFGPGVQEGDTLLVTGAGQTWRADLHCKEASWSDRKIVACIAAAQSPKGTPVGVALQIDPWLERAALEEVPVAAERAKRP